MSDHEVIAAHQPLALGPHLHAVSDWHHTPHEVGLVVLRETDEDAYRECLRSHGVDPEQEPPFFQPVWFYEVRLD